MAEIRPGQRHVNQAHRIAPVVGVGAGHAGGGDGQVGAQHPAGPPGHGFGHLGRHRAELVQQLTGHPQHAVLDLVGIAHHAALEHAGGPGQIGDALGHQPAGTGFRRAQGQPLGLQQGEGHGLDAGHIGAVDHVAQQSAQLRLHRGDQVPGLGLHRGLGGDAQLHLPLLGIGGQGGVGHGVHPVPEQRLHGGLPHTEDPQRAGENGAVGQILQIGQGPVGEHLPALPGWTGEHDHPDPLRFEGAAGGGAPVVGENGAALGQHGLLEVVLGHGPAGVELLKIGTDALGRRLVKDQLFAEGGGQYVLGQIVTGGAQAAGGDEDVGPPLGNLHRGAQPLRVVAHHRVVEDVDADAAESLGDHLGVGVGDVAEEQLGAHGDEFGCVGHDKSLRMPTPGRRRVPPPNVQRQQSISAGRIHSARGCGIKGSPA